MPNTSYQIPEDFPLSVGEPAVAYRTSASEHSGKWNPNVPFHGTQEEWWEHFHRIEEGEFYPVAEVHQRVSEWIYNQKPQVSQHHPRCASYYLSYYKRTY